MLKLSLIFLGIGLALGQESALELTKDEAKDLEIIKAHLETANLACVIDGQRPKAEFKTWSERVLKEHGNPKNLVWDEKNFMFVKRPEMSPAQIEAKKRRDLDEKDTQNSLKKQKEAENEQKRNSH